MRHINKISENKLIFGDNKVVLNELPAYCCHLLIADPPYRFTKGAHKEKKPKATCVKPLFMIILTIVECAVSKWFAAR